MIGAVGLINKQSKTYINQQLSTISRRSPTLTTPASSIPSSSVFTEIAAIFHASRALLTPQRRTIALRLHSTPSPRITIGTEDCSSRRKRRRRRRKETYCIDVNVVSSSTSEAFVRVFKGSRDEAGIRTSSWNSISRALTLNVKKTTKRKKRKKRRGFPAVVNCLGLFKNT